jgi:alpha-tubulin suppressor-like RCC1 family protein
MAAPLALNTLDASSARAAGTEALYAFGDDTDGALGNGTTTDADVPTLITLPGSVTPTGGAAGGDHSLVIGSNGLLYAWGLGTDGQLGNGTTTTSSAPVQVSLPPGVVPVAVAAGNDHSLALGSNGTLYAWGYNGFGQLGNGTTTNEDSPVAVTFPSGVTATAVSAGTNFSVALGSDGNVYAWGDGNVGALGDGSMNESKTPVKVSLPSGVTASAIAAGGSFGMAIGSNGTLYSWGDGDNDQLGNGTSTFSDTPVVVQMPSGVTASVISAGGQHALAIGSNDLLYAWGEDADGQLGNGVIKNEKVPVVVSMPTGVTAVAIAGGLDHSLAIG